MPFKRFIQLMAAGCMVIALSSGACAQDYFYRHTTLSRSVLKDLEKLLPRAMGYYIYRNQDDFMRGITFMTRQIQTGPAKNKDIEEIRREAYARLMRDIPVPALRHSKGERSNSILPPATWQTDWA